MNKSNFNVNKLHLRDFKILKGQIESPFEIEAHDIINFDFFLDFNIGFNLKEKLVKTDLSIDVTGFTEKENPSAPTAKGAFSFTYIFIVENLKDLHRSKKGEMELTDRHLANALAAISFSTSRGILLTRFQGTALSGFILPIIDPNKLLEKFEE
jgi:hypothetical protein